MLRWGWVAAWAWAAAGTLAADPLTLDAAVARAVGHNVTYQTALLAVGQADAARTGVVDWKAIGVSASQKRTSSAASPTTTLGLSLPVVQQLDATVAVDQDQTTTVGFTASPLAHATTSTQLELAYQKALLQADQARTSLVTSTKKAWLAQALAQRQVDAQQTETALMETAYRDAKAQYDGGAVTLAEVRTALKDWTDARTTLSSLQQTLVKARAALAALLQAPAVELAPLSVADLRALVEAWGPGTAAGPSTSVKVQSLELAVQRAKADAVWWVDPGLTVSGAAVVAPGGTTSWDATVTLSWSLGDATLADKALAERAVALAQASLAAEQTASDLAGSQAVLAVQAAAETVESRSVALEQAQALLTETQLQHDGGLATALDVEEAALGVTTAENDLFSAWIDAYGARLDLDAARS